MSETDGRRDGYLPIEDYGAIGNLRTVALVGRDGSIDWCCLPGLEHPSVFGALLDHHRGGRFRVAPPGAGRGRQRYLPATNVLETRFAAGGGSLTVTDYMPVFAPITGLLAGAPAPELHRVLRSDAAPVEVEVEWSPRFDYARGPTRISREGTSFVARGAGQVLVLEGLPEGSAQVHGPEGAGVLRARFRLMRGQRVVLVCRFGSAAPRRDPATSLERTVQAWRQWTEVERPRARERHDPRLVERSGRSALLLRLLAHPVTGAVAAAPTTSLPEHIGGVRNWDYRYSWVRDSSIVAQSLFALGHADEARNFLAWVERTSRATGEAGYELQVMYGLEGDTDLPEFELGHLEGYRGSRPVRVGNAAAVQFQLDIFGELLRAAAALGRIEPAAVPELWPFLRAVVGETCRRWRAPDSGIWEVRSPPRHFVHSKLMAWATMDRALRLARRFRLPAPLAEWARERDNIRAAILDQGFDRAQGSFTRAFDGDDLDASTLLIPAVGLLPADDPRVRGTIDRVMERLGVDGMLFRYVTDDGLPGGEGAFVLCTFWLVDALALAGRLDEAREIFDAMAGRANHLGLLPEEIDPESGAFLGNFPQAFSHAGLVNSALLLAHHGQPPEVWPQGGRAASRAGLA